MKPSAEPLVAYRGIFIEVVGFTNREEQLKHITTKVHTDLGCRGRLLFTEVIIESVVEIGCIWFFTEVVLFVDTKNHVLSL